MAGGVEASQRLRHDRSGLIQSGVELNAIRCRGCVSKVIDVDEAHSGDRARARLDVGWDRQIDHNESPSRARSHRQLHLGSRHQMTRRRRRAEHDVGQTQCQRDLVNSTHGCCALAQALGSLDRSAVHSRNDVELGEPLDDDTSHAARANDCDLQSVGAEPLQGRVHCGAPDGPAQCGESRFAVGTTRRGDSCAEQGSQARPHGAVILGRTGRRPYLALDLHLTGDA